ncbi:MAG: cyclic nucleotide-binding domain-containing protein, partial [Chloroflexi bacterium]|nr:cyclic nucleotide-binding domain-containing protein [Chloroflexota bacterium]
EAITKHAPEASRLIYEAISQRVHQSRLNHVLIMTNVFKNLDEAVLQDVQTELELMTVASGNTVMEAGDAGDALFIVIGGRLRVVSYAADGSEQYSVDTYRGQTVGEIGLITGEKRNATVFALRDSLLAKLSQEAFKRLLQKHPDAMLAQFAGPIIERLRDQLAGNEPPAGVVTTITLIPTDNSVMLAEFAAKLTKAVHKLGLTMWLNSDLCDVHLGTTDVAYLDDDDPKNARFVFWLNEQEAIYDYVIYEADYESTAWTRRCIRQADLVLIVGNANGSPVLSDIETGLLTHAENQKVIQCLLLLHDENKSLPQNTAQWLAPRNVRNHYHLRTQNMADYARIGRLLTGQGVGVVLSGGGARALAHIGVIRALAEKGVPIDAIGAVSGGAIVAGLWAMGLDTATITQKSKRAISRTDYTLPLHALTSGNNWTKSMHMLFGDVQIENLWTSYFCISANLSQAQLMMHESNSLMHAVRASTAIPGILPPVFHDGAILVDGGLINNLPTDIMKARPDIDRVIAIDVGTADGTERVTPFDYSVSGWKSLFRRFNPWTTNLEHPGISEILLRSMSITNAQSMNMTKQIVDLYLAPPVQAYGLLEFGKINALIDIGYQYGIEEVESWQNIPNV